MSWFSSIGEFCGSFGASFLEHRARTKQRSLGTKKADIDAAAYIAVNEGLKTCRPLDDHVTPRGIKKLCYALNKKDHFAAQLAIDANPKPRKREICIHLLNYAVTYLCSKDPADLVRAATYTMLACK
jgi:hypothetical protein